MSQHLGVEVVDALDGLLHVAALHRAADLHPVRYRCQVHPRRRPRLRLKRVRRLNVPLALPLRLRARLGSAAHALMPPPTKLTGNETPILGSKRETHKEEDRDNETASAFIRNSR